MSSKTAARFSRQYWLRLTVFTGVVVLVLGSAGLAYLLHRQVDVLITPVRQPVDRTPAELGLPYRDVTLTSADGLQLAGWHIPGTQPNAIILIHGINANRTAMLPTAALLAPAGYHLLLLDLRGHGESEGSLISYGYREALDVQAGADYLAALPEVGRIGVIGTSLGGAAVARAAANDPRLSAVVIQTSYSSLTDATNDAFEDLAILPQWPFAPLVVGLAERRVGIKISDVDSARDLAAVAPRPVLIIHTQDDHLFPVHHAHKMFNAAGEPKELWIIEDFGHGDPAVARESEYRARVLSFFNRAFGAN